MLPRTRNVAFEGTVVGRSRLNCDYAGCKQALYMERPPEVPRQSHPGTSQMGQRVVPGGWKALLWWIEAGDFIIAHRVSIGEMPDAFAMCRNKEDGCVKVVVNMN